MKSIVMIAGEASGDLYGSHLIKALNESKEPLFICGMGGKAMKRAGANLILNADEISVMGITEVFSQIRSILSARSHLKALLSGLRPDLLILIDFPGFNLHLAGIARSLGIKIFYFISPKIWAWRPKRVKKIKARVDHMAVILPFEESFYRKHGVPVTFVGHPLVDTMITTDTRGLEQDQPKRLPADDSLLTIALCPGSRKNEITRLLPAMMAAGRILNSKLRNVKFLVSCAPSIDRTLLEKIISTSDLPNTQIVTDPAGVLFPKCQFAIVASGTVTLEAAMYGIPMVILYRVSRLSYWLGKALIRVDHIGLVNLIAEKRIAPELIQDQSTPEEIARHTWEIVSNPKNYARICKELMVVKQRLGEPGASERVAAIALSMMKGSSK